MINKKGWELVKLGDVANIVRGSSPRPQGDPRYYHGSVPRLMIEDITRDGKFVTPLVDSLTLEGAKLSRPMKKGDLVITVSGRTGVPAILNVDCCIHDGFAGLRDLSEKIDVNYLFYYLSSLTKITSQQAVGAIFKNLTTDQLKDLQIPLPPLPEQQRIASLLDAADALRRKDRALLQKYEELAQAVFMDMFGDPVKNEKGWEVKTLGEVCESVENIGKNYEFDEIKYIDISSIDNKSFEVTNYNKYLLNERPSRAQQILKKDDILFSTVRPNLKNIAINKINGNIGSTGFFVIRSKKNIVNHHFVFEVLKNDSVTNYFESITSGANYPALKNSDLKDFELIIPSIDEQNEFVQIVKNIEMNKLKLSESISNSESLFSSLLQEAFG